MTYANAEVLTFYRELPFNFRETVSAHVEKIQSRNVVDEYPVFQSLLKSGTTVLEIGCGTGWLSNSISHYYPKTRVTAIDFNKRAIDRASQISTDLQTSTVFEEADLFLYEPAHGFDVVVSIGVLHHTDNCLAALHILADRFVGQGGHLFVGLYHKYGRQPFLNHFQAMKDRGASDDEMFTQYKKLHSGLTDDTHLMSWYRDQVKHPHETQHTLAEILPVLEDCRMQIVSTSINQFAEIRSLADLLEEEHHYTEVAKKKLSQGKYFPGFFAFLARKAG